MTPFANNLRKGDKVVEVPGRKMGEVFKRPFHTLRAVTVKFLGEAEERRVDVMNLRLLVDGKAEDVAPITGEPPSLVRTPRTAAAAPGAAPVDILRAERARIKKRFEALNEEARGMRVEDERYARAIDALEGKPVAA